MDKHKKIISAIILLAAGIIVGLLAGFLIFGLKTAQKQEEVKKLQNAVDIIVPKPQDDIRTIVGTITKINGTHIVTETNDPADYLPHTDGTAQRTMVRVAQITETTEITLISPTEVNKNGNIKKETIKISDLKIGDRITITAAVNIRTTEMFDALLIEKVQF
jgi:hypothetical protein